MIVCASLIVSRNEKKSHVNPPVEIAEVVVKVVSAALPTTLGCETADVVVAEVAPLDVTTVLFTSAAEPEM